MKNKFIPMMFSTEMVVSLLEDRKNQTRRPLKVQPKNKHYPYVDKIVRDWNYNFFGYSNDSDIDIFSAGKCPYGKVGDIIWVRETFHKYTSESNEIIYSYKADHKLLDKTKIWKPSIHMPKEACRLFLEIINVRVEKLYDISKTDALNEGIDKIENFGSLGYKDYTMTSIYPCSEKVSFFSLWQSIYGEDSVLSNPFVWVIEFKKIEKPINF